MRRCNVATHPQVSTRIPLGEHNATHCEAHAQQTRSAVSPSPKDKMQAPRCMEAEVHKKKGDAAFKASEFHRAITHYSADIGLDGTNPTYYTNLAAPVRTSSFSMAPE